MSDYRVSIIKMASHDVIEHIKFDNKEDAEHYAKNQSMADNKHAYEVQKNDRGEFTSIKAYQNGQVIGV
jgi:hypothetical protein